MKLAGEVSVIPVDSISGPTSQILRKQQERTKKMVKVSQPGELTIRNCQIAKSQSLHQGAHQPRRNLAATYNACSYCVNRESCLLELLQNCREHGRYPMQYSASLLHQHVNHCDNIKIS